MMKKRYIISLGILSVACYGWMGYGLERTQTGELLLTFGLLFLCYGLIINQKWSDSNLKQWLWVAIGFRFIFLFSTPALSDDYARFVWDGRLLASGYNPYLYLPSQTVSQPWAANIGLTSSLFERLNSPQYFTVYPPLNQLIFGVAAWLSFGNLTANLVLLRASILFAEIGTVFYLLPSLSTKFFPKDTPLRASLLYGLNPLVIVELTGNLHFEAITLFFLLWTVKLLPKKSGLSATMLALAAGVKLLPLIFVPLFWYRLGWLKGIGYGLIIASMTLLIWLPFFNVSLWQNVWNSLDLYFQKFEFNASFYYLFRQVGYWFTGYNTIQTLGPILSCATFIGSIWVVFSKMSLPEKMLWTVTLYFLLATTVHPWYITTLVAFGALNRRWYPIAWSAALPLTYLAYNTIPYQENLTIVAVEYLIVFGVWTYEATGVKNLFKNIFV
jgi:alpha-1,6-mannosyltransferase